MSAFQNLFGAHGRYFPACPLFIFLKFYYMGLVLLLLGFVYTLEKTDLGIVPMELGCVFFVLMNMNVKNREENNIGYFFL